jgi:hypothetical protein
VKPAVHIVLLALALAGTVWVASVVVGNILENYKVYVGIPPFGTWTYPLAWLAPPVRLAGAVSAVVSAAAVFAKAVLNRIS